MATWIQCTPTVGEGPIYINMDMVVSIQTFAGSGTQIRFPGDGDAYLMVKETPQQIIDLRKDPV